jgi:hypothetical protein
MLSSHNCCSKSIHSETKTYYVLFVCEATGTVPILQSREITVVESLRLLVQARFMVLVLTAVEFLADLCTSWLRSLHELVVSYN